MESALEFTNKYGNGLTQTQKNNFAPRVGFAYQASPKLVIRGGVGLFYNAFENQGYGPNIGENYPFVFNFNYQIQGAVNPVSAGTPYAGCPTAGPGGTATFEAGFSCSPLPRLRSMDRKLRSAGTSVQLPDPRHLEREPYFPVCGDPDAKCDGGVCVYQC